MLNTEDNELLCRVGKGTPMGELMRRYWIPCLPSSEFPEPDAPAKRMTLLGEDFVMFRDTNGAMGAVAEACPHRGASLYFGRVEECGIRCQYHGWKFDKEGTIVDLPTERSDSRAREHFMNTVKIRAYPCHEVNHMIWVYLGEGDPPPVPALETNTLPADHVGSPLIMMEEANWMQNMEGDLDSVHLDWLHRRLSADAEPPPTGMPGTWSDDKEPAQLDVERTSYGAYYSSMRELDSGEIWHRVSQFIFPFHTIIAAGPVALIRAFVPIDDTHAMLISQMASPLHALPSGAFDSFWDDAGGYIPRTTDPRSYFMTVANKGNDYWRDLEVEKNRMQCGIPFVGNLQDRAMTELMCDDNGYPLYNRTKEHLGSTDQMVIAVRAQLLEAAKELRDNGNAPANVADSALWRVRAGSFKLPADADWRAETSAGRSADSGDAIADEVPLIP